MRSFVLGEIFLGANMALHIEVKLRKLTPHDRCDRCGSRAQVLVRISPGRELTLCGHHAAEHSQVIVDRGYLTTSEME